MPVILPGRQGKRGLEIYGGHIALTQFMEREIAEKKG
jgi:hypothetical protein